MKKLVIELCNITELNPHSRHFRDHDAPVVGVVASIRELALDVSQPSRCDAHIFADLWIKPVQRLADTPLPVIFSPAWAITRRKSVMLTQNCPKHNSDDNVAEMSVSQRSDLGVGLPWKGVA